MLAQKKIVRYYYWLFIEFIKKHLQLIVISFLLSFIVIIGVISIYPFINTLLLQKKEVLGLVGNYDINRIPDEIVNKVSNGLVFINEKGEVVPALATSWEQLNQGKIYRFHLRRNLFWSDDKPFDASNIKYNFTDVEVKIVDAYTIDFILKKPLSIFPTYLTKPIIRYPFYGVAGLYRVSRIKTKFGNIKEIHLTPNKKNIPFLIYKFFESENKLYNAYKLGEIRSFHTSREAMADFFKNWKNTTIKKTVDYNQVLTLFFNMNNNLLKENIDLREAIITSIPPQELKTKGEIAYSPIPPSSWAFHESLKKRIYNVEKAKKIIEKYQDSTKSAELNFYTNYDYIEDGEAIVDALKKAGLKINLKLISFSKQNNYDLMLAYWKVPLDPDQYYFWHSTQSQGNITNYNKPKIDKLLEDGRNTLFLKDRKKIYQKFQEVFVDDPPVFFLYYPYMYEIKRR